MTLTITAPGPEQKYHVLRFSGNLDTQSAQDCSGQIDELLCAGKTALVGDLAELKFISSAGIGLLIRVSREAKRLGGDFRLAGAQMYVKEILELSGVSRAFKLYDSVQEAESGLS